jgi:UDP-glucose:glycoprotein glucosyltransferase
MWGSKHARHIFLKKLFQLAQMQLPPHLQTFSVNWLAVSTSFDTLIAAELEQDPEAPKPDLESILAGSDADSQPPLDRIAAYTERLDATHATSPLGHAFFNGKHFEMGDVCSFLYLSLTVEFNTNRCRFLKNFIRQLQIEINQQMSFLQEKVGQFFC